MSIDLPQTGNVFLPTIPKGLDPQLETYLKQLNSVIINLAKGHFNNDRNIANIISSGISGTFTISSGGSIVVTSGIVITVTS